jgi:2-octaprenyl-6-methoxyphenol hydroxylase
VATDHYDIAIVGGGLAGATLACALGASRYRVALLEAQAADQVDRPGYDERTVALAFGSRRILEGLSLWSAIAHAAIPIKTIHVSERGRFGATRLRHAEEGVEALGYVVPNRQIARALHARVAAQQNVQVVAPARVAEVMPRASHVSLAFTAEPESELQSLRCRLLVAADGADSVVRRCLEIGLSVNDYAQTAIVANVTPSRHHGFTAFERFTETGPLALLPMSEERCSLIWTHAPRAASIALRWSDSEFLDALQACFGYRLGRLQQVGKRQAYPLKLSVAREFVRPRVALIGNAAHTLHPVAGQGFNLALRDVAQLVELLMRPSIDDPGDDATLRRYADFRRADVRRTVRFTDTLARAFINPFKPIAYARAAGLLTLDCVPPLRHALARQTMGLRGRVPRLASGVALADLWR